MRKLIILLVLFLSMASAAQINISELSLNEKIAQMIMVNGDSFNQEYLDVGVGGIFLNDQESKEGYRKVIDRYQKNSKIKLLVATDMEGYWNPFPDYKSRSFGEIKTTKQAYTLGKEHAHILHETGFNLDFSPVVESENTVWPGRTFSGSKKEIAAKAGAYINGLQENGVFATAKHYPGGSMIKNPHWFRYKAHIDQEERALFDKAVENNVSAIMVGHPIVSGTIDSNGKPSTVSENVIYQLRKKFDGLIITDDISMFGLRFSYLFNSKQMYVDLVKAGNDVVLDSGFGYPKTSPKKTKKIIEAIANAVEKKQIAEKQIDKSLTRILTVKGYKIVK